MQDRHVPDTDSDFIQEPVIAALKVSPDESLAAIIIKQADLTNNTYRYQLHLWSTSSWRQVYETELPDANVWWVSDTEWLQTDSDGTWQIRDMDGSIRVSGIRFPGRLTAVEILPDGSRDLLLTVQEAIPQDPDYYTTDQLPFMEDGKGYITSYGTLYCYNVTTATAVRLAPERYNVRAAGAREEGVWFLGYVRNPARIDYQHSGFYWLPNTAREPQTLIPDGELRIDAAVACDQGWILAASAMDAHGPGQSPDFWHLYKDGSRGLVAANDQSTSHAVVRDWKPTGRQFQRIPGGVAYLATRRGEVQIYTCTTTRDGRDVNAAAGGKIRCYLREPGTIDAFYCCRNGNVLAVGAYEWNYDELYLYEPATGGGKRWNRRQISRYHESLPAPVSERFSFRPEGPLTGKDAEEPGTPERVVDVCVLYPAGYDPDGAHGEETHQFPAILTIHGGHKLAYGADVLNLDFRLWTQEGYYVIYCNPRGSEGLDDTFADIIGRNAVVDSEDILHALDETLARLPQIDPKRIGITGGSYGGYLTNWLITQTDRFACAVSVRSISNRMSKELDSDTGFRYPLASIGNKVWDRPEAFWEASPLKHIANCHTPTLIVHAEGDRRCPVAEGIQMYTALKLMGVPSRLVIFGGGSHGLAISGRPTARCKHSRVIREWFAAYLQP